MDPGCHRELLLKSLRRAKLKLTDINYVFISHYHPDHSLLIGIFPNATVYDSIQWQNGPLGGTTGDFLPDTDIQIIKTPGHTADHGSLLVPTDQGKILVGADVFWWGTDEDQTPDINHIDAFASDQESLQKSRTEALAIADFIIPGHGKMFPTKSQS